MVELMIAMTLSAIVLVGVLGVLSAETKRLSYEREINDTWHTLRSAAAMLAWDLRQTAAPVSVTDVDDDGVETVIVTPGSIDALTDSSFVIRAHTATGVMCHKTPSGYGLREVNGVFTAVAGDSMQILIAAETPSWRYLRIVAVGTPGTVGPSDCGDGAEFPNAEVGVRLAASVPTDTSDILIGVPFMAYKRTLYGITTHNGERWLGRRVGNSNTWELLTGPLRSDGLSLKYYTRTGAVTTNPLEVHAVRFTLRAQSFGRTLGGHEHMQDTLSVRVYLRN
jgi:hypothetical protein